MAKKDNLEYWQKRALKHEARSAAKGDALAKKLKREYEKAAKAIREKIDAFYGRYASENGLSYAEAVKRLNSKEAREWKKTLGEYVEELNAIEDKKIKARLIAELDARSYASQQDRLSSLQAQIDMEVDRLFSTGEHQMTMTMTDVFTDGYYHKAFDLQQRAGVISEFARLSPNLVEDVLTYPWSGADFSTRLWENKRALLFSLRQEMTQGIIQGLSVAAMSKGLADTLGKSYTVAERLIRTEANHFHNEADKAAYKAAGVEEYEFMATLDNRTSAICGSLDGKHFPLSEAKPGVNYPPMHPHCRSTTIEYDPEDAADWAASGQPMPKNMTYEEWKAEQDAMYGAGHVEKERKKAYNLIADRKQYDRYAETLGKNAPDFEAFQEMKYSGTGEYDQFKAYVRGVKSGELSPLADFDLYKATSSEVDKKIVGLATSQGTKITGKSDHFTNRIIGSIDQRRSGVSVDDVIDALKNPVTVTSRTGENLTSVRYVGKAATVTINPDTGNLIQTNPTHRRGAKNG